MIGLVIIFGYTTLQDFAKQSTMHMIATVAIVAVFAIGVSVILAYLKGPTSNNPTLKNATEISPQAPSTNKRKKVYKYMIDSIMRVA